MCERGQMSLYQPRSTDGIEKGRQQGEHGHDSQNRVLVPTLRPAGPERGRKSEP